jgi:hypothetical protein
MAAISLDEVWGGRDIGGELGTTTGVGWMGVGGWEGDIRKPCHWSNGKVIDKTQIVLDALRILAQACPRQIRASKGALRQAGSVYCPTEEKIAGTRTETLRRVVRAVRIIPIPL